MGRYKKSGLGNGLGTSSQYSISQNQYVQKIEDIENEIKEEIKFNENEKQQHRSTKDNSSDKMENKKITDKAKRIPIFVKGHVTLESISNRREFFLHKSVSEIENILNKVGYKTIRRLSKHPWSLAKIIIVTNSTSNRNISQVQVSPGSKHHGNVPYVKISTNDYGIIKIIDAYESEYKTDGKEKAKLLFRRKKK